MADSFETVRRRQLEAMHAELALAKERLTWPLPKVHDHRDERLRELLAHAKERSPWHRARLVHIDPHEVSGADLSALPVMTKADLMANWDAVVCDDRLTLDLANRHVADMAAGGDARYVLNGVTVAATGGSTGHRGVIALDFDGLAGWVALLRRHVVWLREHGFIAPPKNDPPVSARLLSQNPIHLGGAINRIFGGGMAQIVSLPPTLPLPEIVDRLNRVQPDELSGYASMFHPLALEAAAGRLHIEPSVVIQGGEPLTSETRRLLAEAFGAPVVNMYGATEGIGGHSPADATWLHLSEDGGVFEFVDADNQPVAPGQRATRILLTNVVNKVQPLIRYVLSDEVTLVDGPHEGPWTGRRFEAPLGRSDDIFEYPGAVVHPHVFRSVLTSCAGVAEYQVRQTASGAEIDAVVVGPVDLAGVAGRLSRALEHCGLDGAWVEVRPVDTIDRHPQTGKLRRFIPEAR